MNMAETPIDTKTKDTQSAVAISTLDHGPADEAQEAPLLDPDNSALQRVFVRAVWFSLAFTLIVGIIVPFPMFGTEYIFSRRGFEGWVAYVQFLFKMGLTAQGFHSLGLDFRSVLHVSVCLFASG